MPASPSNVPAPSGPTRPETPSGVRAGLGLLRNVGRGGLGRLGRIGPRRQLLLDPGLLAGELAQVVELRSPHVAAPFHLDRGDEWRIELERPLHALSRRD